MELWYGKVNIWILLRGLCWARIERSLLSQNWEVFVEPELRGLYWARITSSARQRHWEHLPFKYLVPHLVSRWLRWSRDIWICLFGLVLGSLSAFLCRCHEIPGVGWYINSVFFRLIFNPNVFVDFEKQVIISCACWCLFATKVVSSTNISSRTRIYHHHHVVPLARISLTLSRHFSLSFIASGRSSGLHSVSSHSCWMYVRPGRPAFARPYVGVHKSTSRMSSSLLLQLCPAYLVRLTWIGGRWLYTWCLVGCCRQDLFNIARHILV